MKNSQGEIQRVLNGSLPKIEFPEQMLQACPFCYTKHPIIVRGFVKNPETQEAKIIEDRGYSFCNCKNIWYTDWDNTDLRVYDNKYREKYNIDQTRVLFDTCCKDHFPIFKAHNKNIKNFLDIGAIHNGILDNAKKEGWDTTGLDINPSTSDGIHKRYIGNVEDSESLSYLENFDIIWASHIFEHLKNPLITLENLFNKLNPSGMLYIAMPDPFFIDWAHPYNWGHWTLREHHIFWDLQSFIEESEKIGFKCVYKNRNLVAHYICTMDFQVIFQKL